MKPIYRHLLLLSLYLAIALLLSEVNGQAVEQPSGNTPARSPSFSLYDVAPPFSMDSSTSNELPSQVLYARGGFSRAAWFIVIVTVIPLCCCCAIVYAFYQLCCGSYYSGEGGGGSGLMSADSSVPGCGVS